MVSKSEITTFDPRFNEKKNNPQEIFNDEYLIPWLSRLPGNLVLDAASGQGIESISMTNAGANVIAQDVSKPMLDASYYKGFKTIGAVEKLPHTENSIDGILLKDALVYLTPNSRIQMLSESYRVLKSGGSLLISSEKTNMRVWRQDREDSIPYRDIYESNENWTEILASCQNTHNYSIAYHTQPEDTAELAREHGFLPRILANYRFDHPLSSENRWIHIGGFILELHKP